MNRVGMKLLTLLIALGLIVVMEWSYLSQPSLMQNLNQTLIDYAFVQRGEKRADPRIVIVDVDERSLSKLGQWPWSRDKVAKILLNLRDAGVGIIGLDMVFAEEDSSSPAKIAKSIGVDKKDLKDYDAILAQALQNTPTIAGFVFNFDAPTDDEAPPINAIYIQRNKGDQEMLLQAKGVIANIPILQESAYSSGSFNTLPDSDGVVRFVPLLFSYDGSVYPSLSFEMIRVLSGQKRVTIDYDENGISQIKLGELTIPTDAQGRLFVNYRGGEKRYRYISALDIYDNTFDKERIKGSIVLLGTSAAGLLDLRATPFDSTYPGVEVHANVIDNIINSDIIAFPSYAKGADMVAIAVSVLVMWAVLSLPWIAVSFMLVLLIFGAGAILYFDLMFKEHILLNFAYPLFGALLTLMILTFVRIYQEYRQKELIRQKFAKKVSPQVAKELIQSGKNAFSTRQREVSIFFSDIRNFTTISEQFGSASALVEYLNSYMSPMSEVIIRRKGTIDKYIGDAIMAYWNAPLSIEDHADQAVQSAIEQLELLETINRDLREKNLPKIEIGIGIHSGEAIVGEMGSEGRSDYTVIGDSVNLASRIEGLCKKYGAKILISEATKDRLKQSYQIHEVDRVQVKGKEEFVTIYEVLGTKSV